MVANMPTSQQMAIAQQMYSQTQMQVYNGLLGGQSNLTSSPAVNKVRRFFVGDMGGVGNRQGHRIPVIDQKLAALANKASMKTISDGKNYYFVHGDEAIDVLGDYNPMYSGKPKKLAMMMLGAFPSPVRNEWSLQGCGLAYPVPSLIGVRSVRMRLSAAGLALLDHWKEKFPKFAPFMAPYDNAKYRETIISDCYDLTMGHRPASWKEIDDLNVKYTAKAEIRALKKKEAEERRYMERRIMELEAVIHQQRMRDLYNQSAVGTGYKSLTATYPASGPSLLSQMPETPAQSKGVFKRLFGGEV